MGDTVGDMKKVIATVSIIAALGAGAFVLNAVLPAGASSSSVFQTASSTDSTSSGNPSTDPGGPKCMGPRAKFKDVLDGLVSDGTISQDQEDKIIQAFKDAKPEKGPGQGQGPLGHRGRGGAPGKILKGMVDVAADTIGVQPSDLANELRSGKSVADGGLTVLPALPGGRHCVVGFTAHHIVAAAIDPDTVRQRLDPNDLSQPMGAHFLMFLAGWVGANPGPIDVVMTAPSPELADDSLELWRRGDLDDHPRVQRAS